MTIATAGRFPARCTALAAAVLAVVLLVACSKATPERYGQLEPGMTREEVHRLLGEPDEVSGSGIGRLTLTTESWHGRGHLITVTYAGDRLTLKTIEPRESR